MGSRLHGFSRALGICLSVYIPQLILWEISGTVWVKVVGHMGPVR